MLYISLYGAFLTESPQRKRKVSTLITEVTLAINLSQLKHHTFLQTDISAHNICVLSIHPLSALSIGRLTPYKYLLPGTTAGFWKWRSWGKMSPSAFQDKKTRPRTSHQLQSHMTLWGRKVQLGPCDKKGWATRGMMWFSSHESGF